MTKRKVLVPLDGSEFSRQIIEQIRRFLRPDAHELILMRVAEAPKGLTGAPPRIVQPSGPYVPEYASERDLEFATHPVYRSQKMEAAIAAMTDELASDRESLAVGGYTVSTEVRFGDPARLIVEYAEEESVDLIAMTTHGRTGLQRLMAGSVATHVLGHVRVPVFLFRPVSLPGDSQARA